LKAETKIESSSRANQKYQSEKYIWKRVHALHRLRFGEEKWHRNGNIAK